jgi:hypothetical protein
VSEWLDADGCPVEPGKDSLWRSAEKVPFVDLLTLGYRRKLCHASAAYLRRVLMEMFLVPGFSASREIAFEVS